MSVVLAPPAGTDTPPPKGALAAPRLKRWTVAQFDTLLTLDLVEPRRHQLVRGEIVDMGEQSMRHHTSVDAVVDALRAAFGPGFFVRNAGPLQFADSKPEPDASVLRGKRSDYLTDPPPATALLAVEVALSSLTYDLTTKAELYAAAGVPEYWVLDLEGRVLHVFRDPQPRAALNVTTYQLRTEHRPGESVNPLSAPHAVAVADLLP
jgi:Uma2 family endonuclease